MRHSHPSCGSARVRVIYVTHKTLALYDNTWLTAGRVLTLLSKVASTLTAASGAPAAQYRAHRRWTSSPTVQATSPVTTGQATCQMMAVQRQAGPKDSLAHESAIRSRRYEGGRVEVCLWLRPRRARGPRRAIKAIKLALDVILATRLRSAQIVLGRADNAFDYRL